MGRAHSRGLYLIRTLEDDPAAIPVLRSVCGRKPERLQALCARFGWQNGVGDWRELVDDGEVDAFINAAPNDLHAQPTIAAARAGKHVLCEKPLARSGAEAAAMYRAALDADVVHMCGFNYRFFPAIRLAREFIAGGELGEVYHYRSRFLLGSAADPDGAETPWRLKRESAGSGVVGDLLAHHIDLARYLVGEPTGVTAVTRTWSTKRRGVTVDVDDAVACTIEFDQGAIGTLEATRMTPGHVLTSTIEVDGADASLVFDVQRLNELRVSSRNGANIVSVTEETHPYMDLWWPRGHGIGWGDSFTHQLRHFLGAVAGAWSVAPHGATFRDGYRCAQVCDAVLEAAATGRRQAVAADA